MTKQIKYEKPLVYSIDLGTEGILCMSFTGYFMCTDDIKAFDEQTFNW